MNFILFLTDSAAKNHDFQKIGRKNLKISEVCMKFREEFDYDHPRVPRLDPGQNFGLKVPWA